VPREPQGLALDDQVMADARRIVAEAIAGGRLGVDPVRIHGPPARPAELVQPEVERRDLVEEPLEPLARPAEGFRLSLSDLALGAAQAIGAAAVPVPGGAREIVAPQLHAVALRACR
jgi:hypothetical protein